jgi:hypothetical protein
MWRRGYLRWQYLPTKLNENPPIGSKVISGGHTDRRTHRQTDTQTGWWSDKHTFIFWRQLRIIKISLVLRTTLFQLVGTGDVTYLTNLIFSCTGPLGPTHYAQLRWVEIKCYHFSKRIADSINIHYATQAIETLRQHLQQEYETFWCGAQDYLIR